MLDLVRDGDRVVAVVALHPDGRVVLHRAPAVVLATGGSGRLYKATTNPVESTADGLALAARAGAVLRDLEFVGTEEAPAASWFRLQTHAGAVHLRASWQGDRFAALTAPAGPPPFTVRFAIVRDDVAGAMIAGVPVTLTVEGRGAGRVLVYEDASADLAGLIECAWSGELR